MTTWQAIESKRTIWLLPCFGFIAAFAIRLYLVFCSNVITPDGILYIKTAKLIELGESKKLMEFTFIHLYAFLVLLGHKIFSDWETAGRMVSAIMGSLAVIPFFLLIKEMFGVRIAVVSSLFYIINPRLADYSSDVLRDPTFWFFSMTALWLTWQGISRANLLYIVLASLSAGLSAFARIDGVAVFVVIVLWIIWYFSQSKRDLKKMSIHLLVFIFALPVLLSPCLIFFSERLGKWDFGYTIVKVWLLMTSKSGEALELTPDLVQTLPPQLPTFLELARNHQYVLFFSDIILKLVKSINVVFIFLAVFGILGRRSVAYNKNEIPVALWFGVFFITAFLYLTKVYYMSARHGLLLGIPVLIWAGMGFFELKDRASSWLKNIGPSRFLVRNTTAILICIILAIILPKTLFPGGQDKIELKKAGRYLKSMGYTNTNFAGEPGLYRIAFYADSEFSPLPTAKTVEELVAFMRKHNANFLIIDGKTENPFYRNIQVNLDQEAFEKMKLPLLDTFEEYKVAVYRLKDM